MTLERETCTSVSEKFGTFQLEVLTQGPESPAKGAPLVFVHGAFHGAWCWAEHFLPFFAECGYRSVAMSLRGHGESEGREQLDEFGLDDYVDDVAAVVAGLETAPILLGHSLAGALVQKYLERPERSCRGAVLIGAPPPRGAHQAAIRRSLLHPILFTRLGAFMTKGTSPAPWKLFFSSRLERSRAEGYIRRFQPQSRRVMGEFQHFAVERPEDLLLPVLVLGSGRDKFVSVKSLRETARFWQGSLEIIPGMGHDMMLDQDWRSAAEAIAGWLAGLER